MAKQESKNKKKRKKTKRKTFLIAILVISLIVVIVIASYFAFYFYYKDKILPRTKIGSISLANLTKTEVEKLLNEKINKIDDQGIIYKYKDTFIKITSVVVPENNPDLAYQILFFDTSGTINYAVSFGHTDDWWLNIKQQIYNLAYGREIGVEFVLNEKGLENLLSDKFNQFETPGVDAILNYNAESNFSIIPEINGAVFNYQDIITQTKNQIGLFDYSDINLDLETDYPDIKASDTQALLDDANKITENSPYYLFYEDKKWETGKDLIPNWLSFKRKDNKNTIGISQEKSAEVFNNIANEILIEVKESRFNIENGKVIEFQASQDGKKLNLENSIFLFENQLNQIMLNNTENKDVELVVDVTKPQVTTNNINNLGIKELIGFGESNFYGSSWTRIHNVETGANSLNGILIKPGEEFSTIQSLGEISYATGYKSELVIKGNQTIPEIGGGLCQIGTTMFRVAINSGMPITERRPHSYMVSYYDPVGFDATIYDPHPDLRFLNDTGHYILIQSHIDIPNRYIKFEFWGTNDGRNVEKSEISYWDRVSAPATIYNETTDLAPGEKRCTENAIPGQKASFTRKVTYTDGVTKEDIFNSQYKAWPAVCDIGVEPETDSETEKNTE